MRYRYGLALLVGAVLLAGCGGAESPPPAEAEPAGGVEIQTLAEPLEGIDLQPMEASIEAAVSEQTERLSETLAQELGVDQTALSLIPSVAGKYYVSAEDGQQEGHCLYIYRVELHVAAEDEDLGDSASIYYMEVETAQVEINNGRIQMESPPAATVSGNDLGAVLEKSVAPLEREKRVTELPMTEKGK